MRRKRRRKEPAGVVASAAPAIPMTDTRTTRQDQNLYHALGRIEGKIDGFTTQLSEQRSRVDSIEKIVTESARKVAVLEERTGTLEDRPDPAQDIAAIKTRITYAAGVIATCGVLLAFVSPYVVKLIWGL